MYCNLIDKLCFENNIVPFYDNILTNKLTGQKTNISYDLTIPKKNINSCTVADVPDFIDVVLLDEIEHIKVKKIPQYKGYLIDLTKFNNAEDLFVQILSRNPRKNFRAKKRKLESGHDIRYSFHYGEIDKDYYDYLFEICYKLMEERFHEKKIYNRNLIKWKYYHDLFYPLILDRKASIFVISDQEKPITITLNFHVADIVFSHIQIYDVEYSRYSMGDIAIFKNIEWCYRNDFNIWDFSKGATVNKLRWSNHIYQFDYHLFYNSKSLNSTIKARIISIKLAIKQLLRDRNIIGGIFQLDSLYYYTKMKKLKNYDWNNH
ncbi:GNAT family N-acetyltransferase [uncultured Eudoraea sp.]|uniref:GNAT family N-acetyltransferase n=1 Tax=uncultured Eudoraea sp. TaxID=1035614 RepID=UPI00260739DD|nr:GNAT family N-acetyltransferase [uncultured Eudoraea sp.]